MSAKDKLQGIAKEISHYVVTSHPPGGVLCSVKCNFLAPDSQDVIIAKSRRLEIRQFKPFGQNEDVAMDTIDAMNVANQENHPGDFMSPFPVAVTVPINGRITALKAFHIPTFPMAFLFVLTDNDQYAVLSYDARNSTKDPNNPYPIRTHLSDSLRGEAWNVLGRAAECGPLVAVDPHNRCIVLHIFDGLLTVLPIAQNYVPPQVKGRSAVGHSAGMKSDGGIGSPRPTSAASGSSILGYPFHARIEERTVLSLTMLHHSDAVETPPHICILHQDSRGAQHVTTHCIDLVRNQVWFMSGQNGSSTSTAPRTCEWLKKSRIDGGSCLLIPVPPRSASIAAAAVSSSSAAGRSDADVPTGPSHSGGVIVLGQRQITYCGHNHYRVMPIPPALLLAWDFLPPDVSGMPRFLLGDEFGNLHMLTLITSEQQPQMVLALQLDTLGSCTLSSQLTYLDQGLVFVGSSLGDSQLIQIHDEPIPLSGDMADENDGNDGMMRSSDPNGMEDDLDLGDTTYLSVVEEYTHLGPIVDFDLLPTTPGASLSQSVGPPSAGGTDHGIVGQIESQMPPSLSPLQQQQQQQGPHQCQVVTASGCSKSGSLRVIRNGIGMNEYASVELSGIQNMWSLRPTFDATHHSYLVQSYVGETRVLGVGSGGSEDTMDDHLGPKASGEDSGLRPKDEEEEEAAGSLEEVELPGLVSNASTLHVGNVAGDMFLQITEMQVRLFRPSGMVISTWHPSNDAGPMSPITVASANEAGQIVVAMRGGVVIYLDIVGDTIQEVHQKTMDREVSCINLNPFAQKQQPPETNSATKMDVDDGVISSSSSAMLASRSELAAIGLWDDFTVRLLSLGAGLHELLQIHLDTSHSDDDEDRPETAGSPRQNRNNMMARSLCLISLDFSSSPSSSGHSHSHGHGHNQNPVVNMLLVGLGDGTLISFAVVQSDDGIPLRVQSRKEASLGTQRINLIPLRTERGGTCVLATGDRPTVIYLAGISGTESSSSNTFNPKLCYSNVNLSNNDSDANGQGDDVAGPHRHQTIAVNVAAPFFSPVLFDHAVGNSHYSLCVADDSNLRLGVIDDIQKLHITTCRLGMAPRRVAYCSEGRLFAVGCIESGIRQPGMGIGDVNMANCVRFIDDITFEDIERVNLDAYECILSMKYVVLSPKDTLPSSAGGMGSMRSPAAKKYLLLGTGYVLPDEDEPTKGRIIVISCSPGNEPEAVTSAAGNRSIEIVTEHQVRGGVYAISQFFDGRFLATVNSKTQLFQLMTDNTSAFRLRVIGIGHHGHMLSICVSSRVDKISKIVSSQSVGESAPEGAVDESKVDKSVDIEQLAIVGDVMRSISLIEFFPEHETLEEVARDFNSNWVTAADMLTDDVYLGAEECGNLFVLRRNPMAQSEDARCRLDTIGEFHLGEMCNKFMGGSLVMPQTSSSPSTSDLSPNGRSSDRHQALAASKKMGDVTSGDRSMQGAASGSKRPSIVIGSQTLFGTVDGTLGCILGLDGPTTVFFSCLERSMQRVIQPIGGFSHQQFRAFSAEKRQYPSHGFIDGDMIESFMDLDRLMMQRIVEEMNRDGGWETDDSMQNFGDDSGDRVPADAGEDVPPELTVDDVLALVEEIAMLH